MALAAAGAVALTPMAANAKLEIDRIDEEGIPTKGEIVVFADVLDDNGQVIKDQDPKDIKFFFDDVEVPGTVEIKTFKEANQQLGIALLLSAHQGYAVQLDGTSTVLGQEKAGFIGFLKNLSDQDRVAAWFYNEAGVNQVQSWSTAPQQTADNIDNLVKPPEEAKEQTKPPPLYGSIEKVINAMIEDEANQPRRRVLVVMSDGKDTNTIEKPAAVDAKIKAITETALGKQIKIYSVGYSPDLPEPLIKLSNLATGSHGVWKKLEKFDTIPDDIATIANELKNQYVITFRPTDYGGSDKPIAVRMELKAKNGSAMKRPANDPIKWAPKSPWPKILMIAGIAVGSLLGLFLIILLIKKIAKARKNRPQAGVVEEEVYAGPYKGKLACMTGAYAGKDFFLTEDVTTIGSISGNTIVLVESGVSKRHAGIKIEEMRFELADFGSTNGTFVNGAKITKQFLKDGDEVRIGEAKMRFSLK